MIPKEPYFEDVVVGEEIPQLVKDALTTRQLVKWAGASGDYMEIHYDDAYARSQGNPGVIAHGLLKAAFVGQLLTDFVGLKGEVKQYDVSYRGLDVPGNVITCKGVVTSKYQKDGENLVDLEVWAENQTGAKTTPGTATISLPSRS